jgi:hypothetical protein
MSLGYELVDFCKFIKFIKFILVSHISNTEIRSARIGNSRARDTKNFREKCTKYTRRFLSEV